MIELNYLTGWVAKDEHGVQYPWYVASVLELIDKQDWNGKRVFEFGQGNSTDWFRSRGAITEGVDSNPLWARGNNITTDITEYTECILKYPKFDLIVIDGLYRDECFHYAWSRIKNGGAIIIDNYKQASVDPNPNAWDETDKYIEQNELQHEVYKQPGHPDWQTMIIHV